MVICPEWGNVLLRQGVFGVEILADPAGLRDLARLCLALTDEQEPDGSHVHLDRGTIPFTPARPPADLAGYACQGRRSVSGADSEIRPRCSPAHPPDPKSQTKSQRASAPGDGQLRPAIIAAGQRHARPRRATSSDPANRPYKRGVAGSNPAAPT